MTSVFQTEAGIRWIKKDEIWFVGAQELIDLAKDAGLETETTAGDYQLRASTSQSERWY